MLTILAIWTLKYSIYFYPFYFVFLGIVKDNKIDVAVVPFGYTEERNKIVDFLMLSTQEHGYIFVRNPRETFDWEVYTKSLKIDTWIGLLLFGLLVPIVMFIPMYSCKLILTIKLEDNE